ncbi:Hpt domain-containing protein [bacterium]|nr:Hpt domain-containing protein [bacterium]
MNFIRIPKDDQPIIVKIDNEFADLVPEFLADKIKDVDEIREAFAREDFEFIASVAHKIKGSGGVYGIDALSYLGEVLKEFAEQEDKQGIEDVIEDFVYFFEHVKIQFMED